MQQSSLNSELRCLASYAKTGQPLQPTSPPTLPRLVRLISPNPRPLLLFARGNGGGASGTGGQDPPPPPKTPPPPCPWAPVPRFAGLGTRGRIDARHARRPLRAFRP